MSFTIPTAVHLMQTDWDVDANRRGAFTEGQWNTRNKKAQGSLPLSGGSATGFINSTATDTKGCWWTFGSSYDISSDTKIVIFVYQHNAPNRIEIDTKANNGVIFRLGTGTATTAVGPTNYKTWQVGGRDTRIGKERGAPVHLVIDMSSDSEDAEVGTYDDTDVEFFGFGSKTLNMGGSTTQLFMSRVFVFDTTKGATNIPRFTGTSDWDDVITAMGTTYTTKITHGWIAREGNVFSISCPIEIGDGSTTTNFNDNGVSVFYPDNNNTSDPSIRVTENAFRFYLNLPNHATNGTALFSGNYDCGNSYPPFNFGQDNLAVVTFNGVTFKRTGQFNVGSSVTGSANFDGCGVVYMNDNGVNLDGSTFKNPYGNHLLRLEL